MSGPDPAEGRRWLEFAEDDLRAAETLHQEGGSERQTCFLAQQAAEKALKAILIALGKDFPKTHDLLAIRRLIPADVEGIPTDDHLDELTQWAAQARYPGDYPDAQPADADRSIGVARQTLASASNAVA